MERKTDDSLLSYFCCQLQIFSSAPLCAKHSWWPVNNRLLETHWKLGLSVVSVDCVSESLHSYSLHGPSPKTRNICIKNKHRVTKHLLQVLLFFFYWGEHVSLCWIIPSLICRTLFGLTDLSCPSCGSAPLLIVAVCVCVTLPPNWRPRQNP